MLSGSGPSSGSSSGMLPHRVSPVTIIVGEHGVEADPDARVDSVLHREEIRGPRPRRKRAARISVMGFRVSVPAHEPWTQHLSTGEPNGLWPQRQRPE